jgi:Molybdate transporter of MFS superfamily
LASETSSQLTPPSSGESGANLTSSIASERNLALSSGLANVLLCPFGTMPMCHGAGGLQDQYRFDARTGLAPINFSVVVLVLAVGFADHAAALFAMITIGAVGALLIGRAVRSRAIHGVSKYVELALNQRIAFFILDDLPHADAKTLSFGDDRTDSSCSLSATHPAGGCVPQAVSLVMRTALPVVLTPWPAGAGNVNRDSACLYCNGLRQQTSPFGSNGWSRCTL